MIYRALRWCLYAIGLLLILLIGAIGFLQTGTGKRLFASELSSRLSSPESGIEIAELEGWIPLDMRIGAFQLFDREGVWLKGDGVRLDWSPSALIGRRIQVDEISAERVEILRPPLSEEEPEPAGDEPFRLPEMPTSLPPIAIERLAIPEIVLGAALLGETATFALEGSVRANERGDGAIAKLNLERTDQPTALVTLDGTARLEPPTLDLTLEAVESGGIIAALAGRPEIGNVDLRLEGEGPLDDWSGHLRAEVDGLALAEADLDLALVEEPRLRLEGAIEPASGALPTDVATLIGDRLTITLDVVQTKAQALDLRQAEVTSAAARLDAEGAADFDQGGISLQSHLDVPDLAVLSGLAEAELAGAAAIRLDVGGTLDAPDGIIDVDLLNPTVDDKSAASIRTTMNVKAAAPLSSDQPAFDILIDGKAGNLVIPNVTLPDPDLGWKARLAVPLEGKIEIKRAMIETAGSSLSASGILDPETIEGAIDLVLDAPSLQRLAEPYGQPVDGKALIRAAVRLADQAKPVTVDLDGNLDDLEGLPEGAAEFLGENVGIEADVTLDPAGTLGIRDLAINGTYIGLKGEASIDLDQESIDGRLEASLPDLAVLEPLVPDGIAGALDLDVDLGGHFAAPTTSVRLTSDGLVLAGEPISALGVILEGQDLIDAPSGNLKVDITARETPATLVLAYKMADGALNLGDIRLSAPETEIAGDLAVVLDTALTEGAISGRVGNLGTLEPWLQQQLRGSLDIEAVLTPENGRQNADLTFEGRDIASDFGKVKTINASASLSDVTTQLQVDAKGSLTGFEQGVTKIDALTLDATGDEAAVDFELDLAGEVVKTLELSGKGAARFADGFALGIESLEGAFAGEPLRLGSPLALQQADDSIWLSDLDLRLGEARLKGDVEIQEETVLGKIDLTDLPLRWSEVFGGPSMTGEASATFDLGGSVSNPKIVTALIVDGELNQDVAPNALPLDIKLSALLDRGRLAANLEGEGLTEKPIKATASLPARLTLLPFAFDMPEEGALDGRIDVELQLARLVDLLDLDDQKLEGNLIADISIGGTLGEPTVQGPVTLKGGNYENSISGTDIQDLNIEAVASSQRIDLKNLTASTGKKGLIASNGWLEVDPDADFPLSLSLRLDQALLVDRDDAEARITGDIAVIGDLGQAEVTGDLKVDRAEIFLPDGGGPNLPEIQVTERNGRFVNPPEDDVKTTEAQPFDPTLDLSIDMPNKVYVRGRGLESEWQGDLSINGSASNPGVVGSINVKEGYFDFLEKRFELERGEITFSGRTPPNPIIALQAAAEDDDFRAIIKLSGPADDPQFVLSSEPVLPDDEVLARLLFNRPLSEIGPIEAGKLALAVNKLRSSGGGFDAFGEIRNILKIDTLDVVSGEDGDSRVKAGKYLNDDVYVEVERGAADESGRARVEIELLPNLSLEADTSEDANSGVGFKWKFNY